MKYLPVVFSILMAMLLSSCAPPTNYVGVEMPDFKNNQVDSLIHEQSRVLEEYYDKLERGEKISLDLMKAEVEVSNYHSKIIELIDKGGDEKELYKYGDYNRESAAKKLELVNRISASEK